MSFRYQRKPFGLLLLGVFWVGSLAAERVAIVTPDEPSFEEHAAAVYLEHHLGKVDGFDVRILLEEELTPSFWKRFANRLLGREWEWDYRLWVDEGFKVPKEGFKVRGSRFKIGDEGEEVFEVPGSMFQDKKEGRGGSDNRGAITDNGQPTTDNGYTIRKAGRDLHIQAKGTALIHGVHGFLQDDLGFRWYMPGPLGEVVPEVSFDELGDFERVDEPGFRSRAFSGLRDRQTRDWYRFNRMEARYRFHHNVRHIFTPDLFEEHPEVFPLWDGKRYKPPENDPNWQPCFGHPKTAEIAAEAARAFFDENPDAVSFSVGMNDGNRICEDELCQALVDHGRTFRDKPDYSDLVFTFANRVAELVTETHPDKYIGCLAYHWAENTPSFPVHPHVIPYLTADRAQWIDGRFREEDKDLMRRWSEAGPEKIGIYDYYYGRSFVIPRVFNGVMAESIGYAHETGIRGFYAELYPRWSLDGPKAWLAAQLVWDPEADPEALLDDYYEGFFGPAAEPMRAYFEFAEERWASQVGRPYWLRYYFQATQLELFPPEVCAVARECLDEAVAAAGDREPYRARVAFFAEGFRLTELYSRYYHFIRNLPSEGMLSREAGWRFLVDLLVYADHFRELVRWTDEVMEGNPLHRERGERFYERIGFKPEMRLTQWVGPLLEWGRKYGAESLVDETLDRLEAVFPAARIEIAREIDRREAASRPAGRNLLTNGNFSSDRILSEEAEYLGTRGRPPHDWRLWWRPGTDPGFFLSEEETYRGSLALRAEGAVEDYAYVNVGVAPGALYRFSAYARAHIGNGGRVRIELLWWDADGSPVEGEYKWIDQLPEGEPGEWTRLEVAAKPPERAVVVMANLVVESQDDGDWAMFDGVRLEEWGR